MPMKCFCDSCKTNECSTGWVETRVRQDELMMVLRPDGGGRYICDECWTGHVRRFAERLLSGDSPKIGRWREA
jgi:hypothetical protein